MYSPLCESYHVVCILTIADKKGDSRMGSRMAVPLAKATGISFADDLVMPEIATKGMRGGSSLSKSSPNPINTGRKPLSPLQLP